MNDSAAGFRLALSAEELSDRLTGLELPELIAGAAEHFEPGRLAIVSAFGPGSLVIIHAAYSAGIRLPVCFIDTLHHFPETLQHVERVRQRYDLDLRVYRHVDSRAEFEERYGPELWRRDLDRYQQFAKVDPFRRATEDLDAWFTGRRRGQSEVRSELTLVDGVDRLRINGVYNWDRSRVWRYLLDNEIPYNPLHDQGYTSIGDQPLTTRVHDGEDERAGRWRGSDRTECGIHEVS